MGRRVLAAEDGGGERRTAAAAVAMLSRFGGLIHSRELYGQETKWASFLLVPDLLQDLLHSITYPRTE